jgi:hypothetical protein
LGKDFCDGSPGAPISAPKDGPKGLLGLRVPPALCNFAAKIKEGKMLIQAPKIDSGDSSLYSRDVICLYIFLRKEEKDFIIKEDQLHKIIDSFLPVFVRAEISSSKRTTKPMKSQK